MVKYSVLKGLLATVVDVPTFSDLVVVVDCKFLVVFSDSANSACTVCKILFDILPSGNRK